MAADPPEPGRTLRRHHSGGQCRGNSARLHRADLRTLFQHQAQLPGDRTGALHVPDDRPEELPGLYRGPQQPSRGPVRHQAPPHHRFRHERRCKRWVIP